jgi:hypothetical protein
MNDATPLIPTVGSLLGILFLILGLRANRKKRLLQNLPTAKTKGVFIGLVELKGSAESSEPFTSFLAESRCVQFRWSVEEHWSRTVRESYTDSKGRRKTRTRRESGWKTVASGGDEQPFYLQDNTGAVLVHPTGAKLEPLTIFSQHCTRSDQLYYGKGPETAVSNSDHRRRFTELGFPIHTPIYVVGKARERTDVVAPEIAQDATAPLFLISTKSEEQVTGKYATAAFLWSFFGLIFCVAGLIWFDSLRHHSPEQRIPIYVGIAFAYLSAWAIGWVWSVYNSLIDLRNRVRQAWSLVDIQLKRRHDLIPNLVSAVSGLKDHEAQAQTELAELRTQTTATAPGESGSEFHALKHAVIGVVEKYPELKTDEAFQKLQRELADTENRIALARDYFNNISTHYNTRIQQFPDSQVAAMGSMKQRQLLSAMDFERKTIAIDFAT